MLRSVASWATIITTCCKRRLNRLDSDSPADDAAPGLAAQCRDGAGGSAFIARGPPLQAWEHVWYEHRRDLALRRRARTREAPLAEPVLREAARGVVRPHD